VDENKGLQGQPFRNKFAEIGHYPQLVGIINSSSDNDENKQQIDESKIPVKL